MKITKTKRVFDCWYGKQEQSDALQQIDPWARNAPKSEPDVKGSVPTSANESATV